MTKLLLLVLLLAAVLAKTVSKSEEKSEYSSWKVKYGKEFLQHEDRYRELIFKKKVAEINKHNSNPTKTFGRKINKFSAYTSEQLAQTLLGAIPDFEEEEKQIEAPKHHKHHSKKHKLPKVGAVIKDWTSDLTLSNTIRDQGRCGSCWAFASATTIDYAFNIRDGSSILVSSQQLLACSYSVVGIDVQGRRRKRGCRGGWMDKPMYYSMTHKLASDANYPYTRSSWCNLDNAAKGQYSIESYSRLTSNGVCDGLVDYITNTGVAMIAFKVIDSFYDYDPNTGVYSCSGTTVFGINHAMVAVGVTDEAYIIQNSWGADWADNGRIQVSRDPAINCNLCRYSPFIVTVAPAPTP